MFSELPKGEIYTKFSKIITLLVNQVLISMSPWSNFPFVRITFALIGGILAACYGGKPACIMGGSLLGLLLLAYVAIIVGMPRTQFIFWSPWLGFLGLGSVFLIGYLRWWTHEVRQNPHHLTHWSTRIEAYKAVALEDAHEKLGRSNVVVSVSRALINGQWRSVKGKVRVSLLGPEVPNVHYGDILLISGSPQSVSDIKNPHAFDYATFLGFSQIYHQHFVVGERVVAVAHQPPNLIEGWSFQVLRHCQSLFRKYIHDSSARAVVLALVLGQKDDLTAEISDAYARSGTMHVLAVSGLHVGIICWVLCLLLVPFKYLGRLRLLSSGIALLVLWFYAFVTGLSPSVLRAITMFTFLVVASMLGRQTSTYNTLSIAAFLLLFWNPSWIFSVGFQLSYLAVIGILYLQPRIYRLLTPNYWLLDKLWLLSAVSLGAQLSTAPLSVYYFHQFPTYFLLANWVVVPAAFAIVCLGLLVLATCFWPGLSATIAWLLEKVVLGVNVWIECTQKLPYSLVESIYLSAFGTLLLYILLVLLLTFLYTKNVKYLIATTILVMFLSLRVVHVSLSQQTQRKVIFYSIGHHQVISFIKGRHSTLWVDRRFQVDSPKYAYHVRPSQMALDITATDTYMLEEVIQQQTFPMQLWHGMKVAVWQGKKFILLDKASKHLPKLAEKVYIDFLVIEENVVTTLRPLLEQFEIGTLVIGASNRRFLAQKLQQEAKECSLYSHSLSQQGALTVAW